MLGTAKREIDGGAVVKKVNFFKRRYITMERYAWKGRVKGDIAEYKRRHDEIWPEMKEVLHAAGITNYSIWNVGDELFGYYECKNGVDFAAKVQNESPVIEKWNEYMDDILELEMEPNGAQKKLVEVFRFE
jgi:L-rhamnose mutarotase